jgi:hypothetical protein
MSRRIHAWLGVVLLLSCNEVTLDLSGSPATTELDEVILQRAALHEGGANVTSATRPVSRASSASRSIRPIL